MTSKLPSPDIYARHWDRYVRRWFETKTARGTDLEMPGDEWGDPAHWDELYRSLFLPAGASEWQRAVEIGQGSGKYTVKVLSNSEAALRAYDVSAEFLQVCEQRCHDWIAAGRLSLHQLNVDRPTLMLDELDGSEWRRRVDGFYSIDAMVHVDLQYLIVYLITAALVLRPGGKLILTLADATGNLGFSKLLGDIRPLWKTQDGTVGSGKFEWMSPDLVRSILSRLGFEIDRLDTTKRDMRVTASLTDPSRADTFEAFIRC
ncbi:MAG: hypothetical protein ACREK5_11095 [Gemmatimonadota bacterium]